MMLLGLEPPPSSMGFRRLTTSNILMAGHRDRRLLNELPIRFAVARTGKRQAGAHAGAGAGAGAAWEGRPMRTSKGLFLACEMGDTSAIFGEAF